MIIIIAAILFGGLVGVILVGARLRRLIPAEHLSTDSKDAVKRALKAEAVTLMIQLAELRSLVQAQAVSSLSRPLLVALVIWLVVIFLGFAILAPPNTTSTLALLAGAFSVGCAVFIILELDYPFAGVVRIPSEPMIRTLDHLSKE